METRQEVLVDRHDEVHQLNALLKAGEPRLALLTGRRRVGKTFLLAHAWERGSCFLFTASNTTPEINRRQLLEDLAAWSEETIYPEDYPTWRSVFHLLLDIRTEKPLVVVLDEFQYLGDGDGGAAEVASELNAVWERQRPARPILLVLSGSAVGTMEALAAGGGPLYGRFAWQHRLMPFDFWHTAEMVPYADLRDRAQTYGIFGGTPRYLASIDANRSLAENVTDLLLSPTGEVRQLIETALDQEEGLRDVSKYRAILRAVAGGMTERNQIAQRAGLRNDTALRDKLDRLIELGYLEMRQNVDAKPNEAIRYGMADSAFRFHQRFVEPNASMLERYAAGEIWTDKVLPELDAYMGREFERIAVQAYDRLRSRIGLPMVARWGRWEGTDRARESVKIDIVAELASGDVLTGAVKWNREPLGPEVHWRHLDMLQRVAKSGRGWAHQALEPEAPIFYVAAGGFDDRFLDAAERADHPVTCWSIDHLYPEAGTGSEIREQP